MTKFCDECDPEASCCDFCKNYNFNGDEDGCYTGNGICILKNENKDPGDFICDDFHCKLCKD